MSETMPTEALRVDDTRRRYARTLHLQPVRIKMFDDADQLVDEGWGQIADLSASGLRLKGLRLYRQTEITDAHRFELTIVFEDGCQFIEARSVPRWADESGDLGLEFDSVELGTTKA